MRVGNRAFGKQMCVWRGYDGVRLRLCGTVASAGHSVLPLDDTWTHGDWGNDTDRKRQTDAEKNLSKCHWRDEAGKMNNYTSCFRSMGVKRGLKDVVVNKTNPDHLSCTPSNFRTCNYTKYVP